MFLNIDRMFHKHFDILNHLCSINSKREVRQIVKLFILHDSDNLKLLKRTTKQNEHQVELTKI